MDFTARLRPRSSPSTALYTRTPVKTGSECRGTAPDPGATATTAHGWVSLWAAYAPASAHRDAVGLIHPTIVEVSTDNPGLPALPAQRFFAPRPSGVRDEMPPEGVHRRDAHLLRTHHAHRMRLSRCRFGRVQRRSRPRPPARRLSTNTGDRPPGAATQRPHRLRGAPRIHRHLCSSKVLLISQRWA